MRDRACPMKLVHPCYPSPAGLTRGSIPLLTLPRMGAGLSRLARPLPLPACHQGVYARLRRALERSEFARSSRKFRVRGRLHESEPVETPPHPDPLHSPSIGSRLRRAQWQAPTGVNALMASGEREQRRRATCNRPAPTLPCMRGRVKRGRIAGSIPGSSPGTAMTLNECQRK